MILTLDKVLEQKKPEDPVKSHVTIDGVEYMPVGFLPRNTKESIDVMRKSGVTMSDLFFLEPPKTFATAKHYVDYYKIELEIKYEEAE